MRDFMSKNILITGINGFVGSHLAEYVLNNKLGNVIGLNRDFNTSIENIAQIKNKIELVECDITDSHRVESVVKETKPELVFHLAAQSFVPASWNSPVETMNTNVLGSVNLFEAVRKFSPESVLQIACSSEEYGFVKETELPITEEQPLRPLSPYGVSKVSMDLLGYQYFKSYGLKVVRTRAFNHTGPRRGEVFVVSDWSKQIAEIEAGKRKPLIKVGNLETKRDFLDVRDVVEAYYLATQKCDAGEAYNICSGTAYPMKELLNMLLDLSSADIKTEKDPAKMRPSDVQVLVGDSAKFREKTGWKPKIDFKQTLKDTLEYWRNRVK